MRIELPLPSWAETTSQRTDDDAHTLTVAPPRPADWASWQWASDQAPTLRTQVDAAPAASLTLTF